MTAKVKICGINDPVAFDAAIQAGADWVGFVFFPPSPRFVTPAEAAKLSGRIVGGPPRVGLFVNPTDDEIASTLDEIRLDVLQIYGAPDFSALLTLLCMVFFFADMAAIGFEDCLNRGKLQV